MKFIILAGAVFLSMNANAITFCTNAMGVNKGGANWMFLGHDKCPANVKKIPSMARFGYKLQKTGNSSCVYNHPTRTKKIGDKLICETKLTREQAAVKIRKSGITTSGLQRIADRLETPEEELEIHDEEEAAPTPAPGVPRSTLN